MPPFLPRARGSGISSVASTPAAPAPTDRRAEARPVRAPPVPEPSGLGWPALCYLFPRDEGAEHEGIPFGRGRRVAVARPFRGAVAACRIHCRSGGPAEEVPAEGLRRMP